MLTTCFVKNFAAKRNRGFSESLGQEIPNSSESERDRFCHKLSKESIGAFSRGRGNLYWDKDRKALLEIVEISVAYPRSTKSDLVT